MLERRSLEMLSVEPHASRPGSELGSSTPNSMARLINTPPYSLKGEDAPLILGTSEPLLSKILPSCETIKENLASVAHAFRELSLTGKVQVALLIVNLVATFVIVYTISSTQHHKFDVVSLYYGLEFTAATIVSIVYTVCVENIFAFYALIVLQLEVVAFVTTSAVIGVLTLMNPTARWSIVALNWVSIATFLLLQRIVRRSWGWHAYRFAGSSAHAVKAFHEYQQFAAVMLLDVFHAFFIVTAEEVVRTDNSIAEQVSTYLSAGMTLLCARVTQILVRYERKREVWFMFVLYGIGVSVYVYFAILATERAVNRQGTVIDDGENISASGERNLVAAVEWCAVLVRIAFMSSIARVCSSFQGTLPAMFPRRAARSEYLITAPVPDDARRSSASPRNVTPTMLVATQVKRGSNNNMQFGGTQAAVVSLPQASDGLDDYYATSYFESVRSLE